MVLTRLLTFDQRKAVYKRCKFSGQGYDDASLLVYPLRFFMHYTRSSDTRVLKAIVAYVEGED